VAGFAARRTSLTVAAVLTGVLGLSVLLGPAARAITPTPSPSPSQAPCAGTTTGLRLGSHTIVPGTIDPGTTATETVVAINCGDTTVTTHETLWHRVTGSDGALINTTCGGHDPTEVSLTIPPHGTYTGTFSIDVPATCTGTTLVSTFGLASADLPADTATATVRQLAMNCAATVNQQPWPGGFVLNVTVRYFGVGTLNGWTVAFSAPGDEHFTQAWNAGLTQSLQTVTATNLAYNAVVPSGGTFSFGGQGTWQYGNGAPGALTLNGHRCTVTT